MGGVFGSFGDVYSPDRAKPIVQTVSQRLRRDEVGTNIFGEKVFSAGNVVPERINPSWMARSPDRPAAIRGFGDVGQGTGPDGFEMGPPFLDGRTYTDATGKVVPSRCGMYEHNIAWDDAWPCTMENLTAATSAYLRWRGTDSQGADFIQEEQSTQPGGIVPYGKDWWITSICNGAAPLPAGLARPFSCRKPQLKIIEDAGKIAQNWLTGQPAPAATPAAAAQTAVMPFFQRTLMPATPGAPAASVVAPPSRAGLLAGLGAVALAIGASVYLTTRKKKAA